MNQFKTLLLLVCAALAACSADSKSNNEPGEDAGPDTTEDVILCEEPADCPELTEFCNEPDEPGCTQFTGPCGDVVFCRDAEVGCNNVIPAECPEGMEMADCTPGEGTCELVPGFGNCVTDEVCDCITCELFEAGNCVGTTDCEVINSCGVQIGCGPCNDAECGFDETVVQTCPDDVPCRVEMCESNPGVRFSCVADAACPETPDCPAGLVACDTPSMTCEETPVCGTLLLCEPA